MSIQSEYKKQRTRITRLIRSYENKGIDVQYNIPKIPKRITQASVRRLSKITPNVIRKKSYVPEPDTGERVNLSKLLSKKGVTLKSVTSHISTVLNSTKSINQEPIKDTQPETLTYTQMIVYSFEKLINEFRPELQDIIKPWYESLKQYLSPEDLADFLEETANKGAWPSPEDSYNGDKIYKNIGDMMELLDISAAEKNHIMSGLDAQNDYMGELYEFEA